MGSIRPDHKDPGEFNARLGRKSRYVEKPMPPLNWKWIKAMVWVESGGPTNPAWKTRPMQIGNPGDAGLGVLKRGEEGSNLIMDEKLKAGLAQINTPAVNIKARKVSPNPYAVIPIEPNTNIPLLPETTSVKSPGKRAPRLKS